ncbi:hypothetical protein N8D56_20095 [Devosia sp. A8/3-2]|nr:hypothetical protein N8D56_20095 [Devosia sp. A8/3-2]
MYQYFPHKQALLYALNERYLDLVAERVEAACQAQHGASTEAMIEALVTAYWQAKTEQKRGDARALRVGSRARQRGPDRRVRRAHGRGNHRHAEKRP